MGRLLGEELVEPGLYPDDMLTVGIVTAPTHSRVSTANFAKGQVEMALLGLDAKEG